MRKSNLLILVLILTLCLQLVGSVSETTKGFSCSKDTDCAGDLKCWEIKKNPGISICDDKFIPSLRNSIVATGKYGKVCTTDADCKNPELGCFQLRGEVKVCDIKAEHLYIEAVKAKIDTELKTHSVAKNFCTNKWYMVHPEPCMDDVGSLSVEWVPSKLNYYTNVLHFVGSKTWDSEEGYSFICSHFNHYYGENDVGTIQWTTCGRYLSIFDYDILKDEVTYLRSIGGSGDSVPAPSLAAGEGGFLLSESTFKQIEDAAVTFCLSFQKGSEVCSLDPEGFKLFYDDPWNHLTQFLAHYPTGEKSILKEITETTSGDKSGAVAGGVVTVTIPENCQVPGDEDVDGKLDCQDPDCKGKIMKSSNNKDVLCFNEKSNVCGEKNFPTGTTVSNYLCNPDGTWTKGGCVDGTVSQNGKFLCIYSLWQECTKSSKFQGKAFGKYICNNNKWLPIPTTSTTTALGSKIKPILLTEGDLNGDLIVNKEDVLFIKNNPKEVWTEKLNKDIKNLNSLIKAMIKNWAAEKQEKSIKD